MSERPTPETDAEIYPMNGVDIVWPEFSRQLERERDEARQNLNSGKFVIAQHDVITDLILENKKLKAEIAQLKKDRMNVFYERINDGELFVYDEENKKFYLQEMKEFKDRGHLISEYTEETLDKLVRAGSFKKHIKNPVVIAQHEVITNLILEHNQALDKLNNLNNKLQKQQCQITATTP